MRDAVATYNVVPNWLSPYPGWSLPIVSLTEHISLHSVQEHDTMLHVNRLTNLPFACWTMLTNTSPSLTFTLWIIRVQSTRANNCIICWCGYYWLNQRLGDVHHALHVNIFYYNSSNGTGYNVYMSASVRAYVCVCVCGPMNPIHDPTSHGLL